MLAPEASRAFTHIFSGGVTVRKGFAFATLVAILTIAALGVLMLKSATPVSAQEILNRAYAAQTAAESQGILHTKTQVYMNMQAMPGPKSMSGKDVKSILESYVDPQTGKNRLVVTDEATGEVMSVSAFDGTFLYTSGDMGIVTHSGGGTFAWSGHGEGTFKGTPASGSVGVISSGTAIPIMVGDTAPVHTIYRIPQPKGTQHLSFTLQGGPVDVKTLFEAARQDPNAKFIGEQTLSDGRQVYVLELQALAQLLRNGAPSASSLPPMNSTLYFDKQSYQLVEQRTTMQQNGKETVVNSMRQLVQETLPPATRVAWDLSDLKGINIVDDPKGEHGPQWPVSITQQELAARTHSAYILKTVPAGYTMQITATSGPDHQAPGLYSITYSNSSGDSVMINGVMNAGGGMTHIEGPQSADETYTTRSGLKLDFVQGPVSSTGAFVQGSGFPKGASLTHVIVQAPDGTLFDLASTLPRDQLKALAEELVPVR